MILFLDNSVSILNVHKNWLSLLLLLIQPFLCYYYFSVFTSIRVIILSKSKTSFQLCTSLITIITISKFEVAQDQ